MDFFAQQRIMEGSSSPADEIADEENSYCESCNGSGHEMFGGHVGFCSECEGSGLHECCGFENDKSTQNPAEPTCNCGCHNQECVIRELDEVKR